MCGRVKQVAELREIRVQFAIPDDHPAINLPAHWNGPPTEQFAVVRRNPNNGRRSLDLLRWGLVPWWSKEGRTAYATFNAQSETLADKPAFRDAWRRGQRCVIPLDAFYEWRSLAAKRKQPYAIAATDGTLLAVGGLWEAAKLPDGSLLRSFTIITTPPNSLLEPFHNRMPLILGKDDLAAWLGEADPGPEAITSLLRPCPEAWLRLWPVDARLSNVRNQDAEFCQPIALEEEAR
jgi:putative SOS response-associated peptidase YedK